MSAFVTYLIAGIAVGCSYALVGSGLVVVHRITGVVNFAQGALAVFGGLIAGSLLSAGLPHGVGEIVAALACGVIGLGIGAVALGHRGTTSMISLVITLGLSILAYAAIIMIWGDGSHSSPGVPGSVQILGGTVQVHYFVVILVTIVTFAALGLFFGRSYIGKAMSACASNPYAARMVGIDVRRMGLIAFAIAGVLGGLAGVILTPLREVSYSSDVAFALNGFAAAVFGGLNSPGKTVIGGLVLGIVSLMVAGYLDSSYQIVAALTLMLAVMIVRGRNLVTEESEMTRTQWIGLAAFVVVAAIVPTLLGAGALTVYVNMVLAAIVATGVALLMGFAGQVSLGQGAFFAIGALTSAVIAVSGAPHLLALLAGTLVAGALGFLVGIPLLRLRGHYLAFGTLALQIIALTIATKLDWFGGPGGIQGVPQLSVLGATITSPLGYAYLALGILVVVLIVSHHAIASRFGRGLRALSGSESAAESAGVPVSRYKVTVFALGALFAGLAGAVYPFVIGFVSAGSFSLMMSFQYVVMAVVGGMATIWGGVAGAVVLTMLVQALNLLGTAPGMPATAPAILNYAVYAILLILALLFLPRGLLPSIGQLWTHVRERRQPALASAAAHTVASHPSSRHTEEQT